MNFFNVLCNSTEGIKARCGIIKTSHSEIETPVFMPVGTLGTVKAVDLSYLNNFDCRILLSNTYHLYLRPGCDVLENAGGLHKFMNWNKSILTDSGGFQIFSLSDLKKITGEGVEFSSHIDGSKHFFTPEKVVDIQRIIGSDIMMPLDECMPYPISEKDAIKSLEITHNWEKRCLDHFVNSESKYGFEQFLFSINQGSTNKNLRKESIEFLDSLNFSGNAIGGLAVGEPKELMNETVEYCVSIMNPEKPVYLMGVGTPEDLLNCIENGVDMFDCVLPTRNARHGKLYTTYGEINIKNLKYKFDNNSPDEECKTYTSENYSLSYLRHLFLSGEILGSILISIHNLGFYLNLMKNIRVAIKENRFLNFKKDFLNKYLSNKNK
ncbi:MAG TPA: tRNA guanosine(34) transglycosylase Tgt [Bacteroidetes bacterium]|nr:tRNA guanosine(34) transglycosylase Tgt [Ignavibacteria bacterium]HCA42408.1 tRNA guanosine(34) transglycosylase Tgt [Bacteroidota bacterium]